MAKRRFLVVTTNSAYAKYCQASLHGLPAEIQRQVELRTFDGWEKIDWKSIPSETQLTTLFVSRLADIPTQAIRISGQTKHLLFIEDLPVQAISARVPRLNNRDRLHITQVNDPLAIEGIISRAISGLASGQSSADNGSRPRIVDAWSESDALVVLNSSFDRLVVPWGKLEKLLGNDVHHLTSWQIDEDGSFLFWLHADVHLGWDQLLQIVEPVTALRSKQRTQQFNQRYGAAIRSLREQQGIPQSAIPGVSDRHLRRIERGLTAATTSVLRSLAEAHQMTVAEYLEQVARHLI